jgi:hypothetical protein
MKNKYFKKSGTELFSLASDGDLDAAKERNRRSEKNQQKSAERDKDNSWQEKSRKSFVAQREKLFTCRQQQLSGFLKEERGLFFEHVGYTADDLRTHFEVCFQFWSSYTDVDLKWEDYGIIWQVDHVKPRLHKSFYYQNISDDQACLECFSLNNLRPTPSAYNRYKGSYYALEKKWYYKNRRPSKTNYYANPEKIPVIDICEILFADFLENKKDLTKQLLLEQNREFLFLIKNFHRFFIMENK